MNDNNIKSKLKRIPLAAIIFPPIGIILLLQYMLNKYKKEIK